MKQLLLCTLLFTSLVACKRNIEEKLDANQIQIGVKNEGETPSALDVFALGDNIGIFTIETTNDGVFAPFIADNYGYTYNTPYWNPLNGTRTLKWQKDEPSIYFYAYHPYVNATAGPVKEVTPTSGDVNIKYELPTDQSATKVKENDLMLSVNKGVADAGFNRNDNGTNPITLSFKHKLCKLHFKLNVTKDADKVVAGGKAYVTEIIVSGKQIANTANLLLKAGTLSPVALEADTEGQVVWTGSKEVVVDQTLNNANTVSVTDLLILPFEPETDANMFTFKITYNDGTGDVNQYLKSKIEVPTQGNSAIPTFKENQYNILTVKANLSDSDIKIKAEIVDWDAKEFDITPQ